MQTAYNKILLISREPFAPWVTYLQKVLKPIEITNLSVSQLETLGDLSYSLIVIDFEDEKVTLATINFLLSRSSETPIYVVSISPDWVEARAVFRAGATDYLSRLGNCEELVTALKIALIRLS